MDPFEISGKSVQRVSVDIAPLIDMVFILLIFFIVTSTFTRETGVEVDKPRAQTATELDARSILIAITRDGAIYLDERQVELGVLGDMVEGMLYKNPGREVVLISDRNSRTGRLMEVMDAVKLAGAAKISVAAQAP